LKSPIYFKENEEVLVSLRHVHSDMILPRVNWQFVGKTLWWRVNHTSTCRV